MKCNQVLCALCRHSVRKLKATLHEPLYRYCSYSSLQILKYLWGKIIRLFQEVLASKMWLNGFLTKTFIHIGHGLAKIYDMLAFILALSV